MYYSISFKTSLGPNILILTFKRLKKRAKIECDTKLEEPILDIYYDTKRICFRMSSSLILIPVPLPLYQLQKSVDTRHDGPD